MRYLSFVIENYRAITGPLKVEVGKGKLTPIIGVNESGKTTILQAIFSFDHFNDSFNDGGRHLRDTANLYSTSPGIATITAEIELSASELDRCLANCERKAAVPLKALFARIRRRRRKPDQVRITRFVETGEYEVTGWDFGSAEMQGMLCKQIIAYLPYILYFDDFRDKIAERLEIPDDSKADLSDWLAILERLFKQTEATFSIFKLAAMEPRQRRTVIAKVQRHLNETLTKEWQTFRLDERDALKISLEFEQSTSVPPVNSLKLDVVEKDGSGDEHYFYISDRSKGFYWFFNFVMKLEFNPKVSSAGNSIYLLDEPGSYLHAFAQRKLCAKLKHISNENTVIYCTHSHYLLDPDTIPINNVVIADKDGNGSITLTRMNQYRGSILDSRSALQPVLDALQVKPYAIDLIHSQMTIITEGIYDYMCLMLFRGNRNVSVLPSVGADSIKFYVSLMIAWQVPYRALWDNDPEGRKKCTQAAEYFGEEVAKKHFRLLPAATGNRIMQGLFSGEDLRCIRERLAISSDVSFERTIQTLYYSEDRAEVVQLVERATRENFTTLFRALDLSESET